jgi:hypothetical protein
VSVKLAVPAGLSGRDRCPGWNGPGNRYPRRDRSPGGYFAEPRRSDILNRLSYGRWPLAGGRHLQSFS